MMENTTSLHPVVAEDLSAIIEAPLDWDRFAGKTVLVTGASGFLPAYMVETLLFLNEKKNLGCRVVGLVRNMEKARTRFFLYQGRDDLHLIKGDVSQEIQWPMRCDFIVHAASQASPKFYGTDPVGTMSANLLGSYHLLNQAKEWAVDGFLFFSSGEVYGQVSPDKIPTRESDYGYIDITNSRSCYAEGKRAAETLGVSYASQFGVPFKIVRPFHTYGPGMALDDGRVFADFVRDVIHSKNLVLQSDGKAIRAFCYLSDAVRGFFTVLLKGQTGAAYNVGNPDGAISIGELANLLVGLFPERHLKVERRRQTTLGYLPSPISVNVPNVDRLKQFGWNPVVSVEDGFKRTIQNYL